MNEKKFLADFWRPKHAQFTCKIVPGDWGENRTRDVRLFDPLVAPGQQLRIFFINRCAFMPDYSSILSLHSSKCPAIPSIVSRLTLQKVWIGKEATVPKRNGELSIVR